MQFFHYLPIYRVEEEQNVQTQFNPSFKLASGDFNMVEDGGGVMKTRLTHHWTLAVPENLNS